VKLEAILLTVNVSRSPIKLSKFEDKWYLTLFTDGTVPYKIELWRENQLKASLDLEAGISSESRIEMVIDQQADKDGFKFMVVVRSLNPTSHIISHGRMLAGVQVSHLTVVPSKDGKSFDVKFQRQKVLISNFEVDLFEIFGQPLNIAAAVQPKVDGAEPNRSQASLFSSSSADQPGFNRECVVCLSQRRDTLFLPCRHMCLCLPCAESLCQQSDKCPICRQGTS